MFYEETVINGVLMCRSIPRGTWSPVSQERMTERLLKAERRYRWAANELLACDYGDNDKGGIGWLVYGWRQPKDIQHHERKRIYGKSIDEAIDSEIA